jgi:rod shape-determining protein MreC
MPRNKVAWRRIVFVVLIIASLAVLTVSFRETESGPVHAIRQGAAGLLAPMQSWGDRIAQPFQDGYHWLTTLWSAHQDAERLAEQVQVLQGEVIKLQEQGEENERLRSLLDLKDKGTFPAGTDFIVARVMAKSPTKWQAWVEIDKGSDDGLKVDMAVVGSTPVSGEALAGKGLVGKIIAVTPHSAKVQLITDSESSVGAKIQGSRAEGIVEGSVSGRVIMDYVDRDISVEPKLVIVTSGYGGVYPPDIPIGIVVNVGEEDVNSYKAIEVRPFLDFRVLEEVMVLIVPDATTTTEWPTTTTLPSGLTTTTVPSLATTTTTTSVQATSTTTTTR